MVLNGAIRNPSMTDWRYVTAYNGWMVTTRVPTVRMPNGERFSFEPGESITVTGTVELELFTVNRRRLGLFGDVNKPDEGKKEASYELKVQLTQDDEVEKGIEIGLTSASYFNRAWLVSTTTAIALIHAML